MTYSEKQRESESPAPKKYFDEEWPKEEAILAIGLKQSRLHKQERQEIESKSLNRIHQTCDNTTDVKGNRK